MKLVTIRDGISSGIHPSVKELEIPLWKSGANVRFLLDRVEKITGWAQVQPGVFNFSRGMHQLHSAGGTKYVFWATGANLIRWDGVTSVLSIGVFSGIRQDDTALNDATTASFATWGSDAVVVSGTGIPQRISAGSPNNLVVPELSFAKIVRTLGPHMLAFATQAGDTVFQWCSANNLNDWDFTSTTNTAGTLTIQTLDGAIKCVEKLGDRLAVYADDSMHIITYIGGGFIFAVRYALNGIGAVGHRSVVHFGRKNYGYSKKGFFVTDGAQFTYIDSPAIREYVAGRINPAQLTKVCAYHDEQSNQIRWFYPAGANLECSEGVGYDYLRDAWTIFDFAMISVSERSVFDYPIGVFTDGRLQALNVGVDSHLTALPASIKTKRLDLGDANVWKFVDQLKLECAATVTVEMFEDLTGPALQTITANLAGDFTPMEIQASARFFTIEISSVALGAGWSLGSIDVLGAFAGSDA